MRFEALPMRPNAAALTNPDAHIVGMGPMIGGPVDPMVDSHQRLRERLNAKRKKPYVLDPSVPTCWRWATTTPSATTCSC